MGTTLVSSSPCTDSSFTGFYCGAGSLDGESLKRVTFSRELDSNPSSVSDLSVWNGDDNRATSAHRALEKSVLVHVCRTSNSSVCKFVGLEETKLRGSVWVSLPIRSGHLGKGSYVYLEQCLEYVFTTRRKQIFHGCLLIEHHLFRALEEYFGIVTKLMTKTWLGKLWADQLCSFTSTVSWVSSLLLCDCTRVFLLAKIFVLGWGRCHVTAYYLVPLAKITGHDVEGMCVWLRSLHWDPGSSLHCFKCLVIIILFPLSVDACKA